MSCLTFNIDDTRHWWCWWRAMGTLHLNQVLIQRPWYCWALHRYPILPAATPWGHRHCHRCRYLRHHFAGVHPPVNLCEWSVFDSELCLCKTGSSSLVHTFSLSSHMSISVFCSQSCTCIQREQNQVMLLLSQCWLVPPRLPLTFHLPFSIHSLSVL